MSKGRSHFNGNAQKSNVKTEEKFKKHGFIEGSATKQHRLTHPDSPISAPQSTRFRTLAKLSPMIEKTLL